MWQSCGSANVCEDPLPHTATVLGQTPRLYMF